MWACQLLKFGGMLLYYKTIAIKRKEAEQIWEQNCAT